MYDLRSAILRSLRYHAPNEELRESFILRGNTMYCNKPDLLKRCNSTSSISDQGQTTTIGSYIRKAPSSSTGRRKVSGYKRKPKQQSLEERLVAAEPSKPFVEQAIMNGVKIALKYRR